MPSASPLKEPSMDEILASIRRIIESGDERTTPNGTQPRAVAGPGGHDAEFGATGPRSEGSQTPIPRFDVRYASPHPIPANEAFEDEAPSDDPPPPQEPQPATASAGHEAAVFDEDWGRLRHGDEPFTPRDAPYHEAEVESVLEPSAPDLAGAPPAENQNALPTQKPVPMEFSLEFDDEAFEAELRGEAWTAKPAAAAQPRVPAPAAPAASAPWTPPARMPDSVIDGASALLSAQAGDQVAAAFDDLAQAIRDGQMRSMEEMTREMLRPMLQEWLDDNLPRMVERLVREEIERIARGPRR